MPSTTNELARDARRGLLHRGQKTLPSKWLYDDLGSTLFDAITLLPEYGLTRADLRLLETYAGEIARRVAADTAVRVIELGSGGGRKTKVILQALANGHPLQFHPIDVSQAALDSCVRELDSIAAVHPVRAAYDEGIAIATAERQRGERLFTLFLGSNIGNFEPDCAAGLLRCLRQNLQPGDALLIGLDLMKPCEQLIAAYDDPVGVTAAFNRNILARLNRELGACFPLDRFAHEARFDSAHRRMEMHLRALASFRVDAGELGRIDFEEGETIWTESSYKFDMQDLPALAARCGFRPEAHWVDPEWPFAECLWLAS